MEAEFLYPYLVDVAVQCMIIILPAIALKIIAIYCKAKHNEYVESVKGEEKEKALKIQEKLKEREKWWQATLKVCKGLCYGALGVSLFAALGIIFGHYSTYIGTPQAALPTLSQDLLYTLGTTVSTISQLFIAIITVALVIIYLVHKVKVSKLLDEEEREIINKYKRRSEIFNLMSLAILIFVLQAIIKVIARLLNTVL